MATASNAMTTGFVNGPAGPLHVVSGGDRTAPAILFLHGFPEYHVAWLAVARLLANSFHVILPDMRGFGRSAKPGDVTLYRAGATLADTKAIADAFSPDRPLVVAGHDWGASAAYAFAFAFPSQVECLIVANGVHPWCFQNALLQSHAQRKASAYIHRLRADGAEGRMSENGFARTMRMLEGFSATQWMTPQLREGYLDAWSQPGAMTAMLNWYRASPLLVPDEDDASTPEAPVLAIDPERMTVRMPHLVLWGEQDRALLPECLDGLERFCQAGLTVRRVPQAGHWILHEQPQEVADAISAFCV